MVTILVFMELALQFYIQKKFKDHLISHNPCFYGISFAMILNFWIIFVKISHNPCFYGISFAISEKVLINIVGKNVTILVFMELALQ